MRLKNVAVLLALGTPVFADMPVPVLQSKGHTNPRAEVLPPVFKWGQNMSFALRRPQDGKPPLISLFNAGKSDDGTDLSGTLWILKKKRGKSKLYKDEDSAPGLIVVFKAIGFEFNSKTKAYDVVLQGEYNAVKFQNVPDAVMRDLFAGKKATLSFECKTTGGIYPTYFEVASETVLTVHLEGDRIFLESVEGNCTITVTNSFTESVSVYKSKPVSLEKKDGQMSLFTGQAVKQLAAQPFLCEG